MSCNSKDIVYGGEKNEGKKSWAQFLRVFKKIKGKKGVIEARLLFQENGKDKC